MHQRYIFILSLLIVFFTNQTLAQKPTQPSLKETFKNDFLIGTALNSLQIMGTDTAVTKLVLQQFNAVTPENMMKATYLHPAWDKYIFRVSDLLVAFAQKNNIKINGHTLIWHSQLPEYVKSITSGEWVMPMPPLLPD